MVRFFRFPFLTGCLFFVLLFAGCNSGGSSGSGSGEKLKNISGVVEDGPVFNAKVYVKGIDSGSKIAGPFLTNEKGEFSFNVKEDLNFKSFYIEALGGKDNITGLNGTDLTGIAMKAPMEMFENSPNSFVVSPLTTLVAFEVEKGLSLKNAEKNVIEKLGLSENTNLRIRPTNAGGEILAKTMMLTLTAVEINKQIPDINTFSQIKIDETTKNPDITGFASLREVFDIINKADKNEVGKIFQKKRLENIITEILNKNSETPLDEKDKELFVKNRDLLIDSIFTAAGDVSLKLDGFSPERVARYVLVGCNKGTYQDFLSSDFEEQIKSVQSDKKISGIFTSVSAVYDVSEKLFDAELPGDDNAKRVDYYYKSNISNLFKAEKVINETHSDELTDSIMVSIVKGKARNGFFTEAESIIETQIFRVENKGHAWVAYGDYLLTYNKIKKAVEAFEKAEECYKQIIESRGEGTLLDSDGSNITGLFYSYFSAGEEEKAFDLLDYLEGKTNNIKNPSVFSRVIIACSEICKDLIKINEESAADRVIEKAFKLAKLMPNQLDGTYNEKLISLLKISEIYGLLKNAQGSALVFDEFWAVVYQNGEKTPAGLNAYRKDIYGGLFVSLYKTENYEKAEKFYNFFAENAQATLITDLLTYIVTNKGMGTKHAECPQSLKDLTGEDILAYKLKLGFFDITIEDAQVEALTYYNAHKPYVAKILIDQGDYEGAVKALESAEKIVDTIPIEQTKVSSFVPDLFMGSSKLYWGYARIAGLYGQMKDFDKAEALLAKCESYLDYFKERAKTGETPEKVEANKKLYTMEVDKIAENYIAIGKIDKAVSLWGNKELVVEDYNNAIKAMISNNLIEDAYNWLEVYVEKARAVFDNSSEEGVHNEDNNKKEVTHLMAAAFRYIDLGEYEKAAELAAEAKLRADQVKEKDKKYDFYIDDDGNRNSIIEIYNEAGFFDKAIELAALITAADKRNDAFSDIANYHAYFDAFKTPSTNATLQEEYYFVASVDTDKDGRPDFFSPSASEEDILKSGLILDDDSDGDGVLDVNDPAPFCAEVF